MSSTRLVGEENGYGRDRGKRKGKRKRKRRTGTVRSRITIWEVRGKICEV